MQYSQTGYYFDQCKNALQFMEEIGGPQGEAYVEVMRALVHDLNNRIQIVELRLAEEALRARWMSLDEVYLLGYEAEGFWAGSEHLPEVVDAT